MYRLNAGQSPRHGRAWIWRAALVLAATTPVLGGTLGCQNVPMGGASLGAKIRYMGKPTGAAAISLDGTGRGSRKTQTIPPSADTVEIRIYDDLGYMVGGVPISQIESFAYTGKTYVVHGLPAEVDLKFDISLRDTAGEEVGRAVTRGKVSITEGGGPPTPISAPVRMRGPSLDGGGATQATVSSTASDLVSATFRLAAGVTYLITPYVEETTPDNQVAPCEASFELVGGYTKVDGTPGDDVKSSGAVTVVGTGSDFDVMVDFAPACNFDQSTVKRAIKVEEIAGATPTPTPAPTPTPTPTPTPEPTPTPTPAPWRFGGHPNFNSLGDLFFVDSTKDLFMIVPAGQSTAMQILSAGNFTSGDPEGDDPDPAILNTVKVAPDGKIWVAVGNQIWKVDLEMYSWEKALPSTALPSLPEVKGMCWTPDSKLFLVGPGKAALWNPATDALEWSDSTSFGQAFAVACGSGGEAYIQKDPTTTVKVATDFSTTTYHVSAGSVFALTVDDNDTVYGLVGSAGAAPPASAQIRALVSDTAFGGTFSGMGYGGFTFDSANQAFLIIEGANFKQVALDGTTTTLDITGGSVTPGAF